MVLRVSKSPAETMDLSANYFYNVFNSGCCETARIDFAAVVLGEFGVCYIGLLKRIGHSEQRKGNYILS